MKGDSNKEATEAGWIGGHSWCLARSSGHLSLPNPPPKLHLGTRRTWNARKASGKPAESPQDPLKIQRRQNTHASTAGFAQEAWWNRAVETKAIHTSPPRTEQPAHPPNQRHTWHTNPWRLKSPAETTQVAQSHSKVPQAWCQMRQNATNITGHIV